MITKDLKTLLALIQKHRGELAPLSEHDIRWILSNPEEALRQWVQALQKSKEQNTLLPWRKNVSNTQLTFTQLLQEAKRTSVLGGGVEETLFLSEPENLVQTLLFEETHQLVRIEVRDLGFSTGTTLGVLTGPDMLSCWSDRNLRTQRVEPCTAADMLTSCRTFKVSDGTCWAGMLPVQGKILFVRHDGQRTILKAVEGDLDTHYGPRRHVILKLINLN